MPNYKIILHRQTLGVSEKALTALRNELAARFTHSLDIGHAPSTDESGYGLVILDHNTSEAVIIADGFTEDGTGEGGKAHRAATALLELFGFEPLRDLLFPELHTRFVDADPEHYRDLVEELAGMADVAPFKRPQDRKANYVDWIFAGR